MSGLQVGAKTLHGEYVFTVFTLGSCILYNTLYSHQSRWHCIFRTYAARTQTDRPRLTLRLRCIGNVTDGADIRATKLELRDQTSNS